MHGWRRSEDIEYRDFDALLPIRVELKPTQWYTVRKWADNDNKVSTYRSNSGSGKDFGGPVYVEDDIIEEIKDMDDIQAFVVARVGKRARDAMALMREQSRGFRQWDALKDIQYTVVISFETEIEAVMFKLRCI